MKIKGKFERITELSKGDFRIEYIDRRGMESAIPFPCDAPIPQEVAKAKLEEAKNRLENEQDDNKRINFERAEDLWTAQILWPEMFAAHCGGESLDRFFSQGVLVANTLRDLEFKPADSRVINFKRFVVKSIPEDVWKVLRSSPEGKEFFWENAPVEQREEYVKWLESLSDVQLLKERDTWRKRQKQTPVRNENIGLELRYWTLDLAEEEVNRRLERALRGFNQPRIYMIQKVKRECDGRSLPKGVTIDRRTKYEIAKAIGLKPGKFSAFRSGGKRASSKTYHRISKMLSELGYHREGATRYNR